MVREERRVSQKREFQIYLFRRGNARHPLVKTRRNRSTVASRGWCRRRRRGWLLRKSLRLATTTPVPGSPLIAAKPDSPCNHAATPLPRPFSFFCFFFVPTADGDNCFMPAGSKALYAGSFILRLPCRASGAERESGLINNHTYPIRSLSLSLFSIFLSSRPYFRSISLSLSFSLFSLPFHVSSVVSPLFFYLFVPLLFPFFLFFLPSFPPLPIKANLQQRVRAKIKSELICHERAPLLDHDCCGYDHATLMSICIPELTI